MAQVNVTSWCRDGSPSGVGAVIDVLDAANRLPRRLRTTFSLGVGGDPVRLRGGLTLAVTNLTD